MKPHPTDKMLAQLLFSLDNDQLVLFAHLVGCEACRKILAEMPLEEMERYAAPKVRTASPSPAEPIAFPRDENGRPQPPRLPRKGAIRRSSRYRSPFHPEG